MQHNNLPPECFSPIGEFLFRFTQKCRLALQHNGSQSQRNIASHQSPEVAVLIDGENCSPSVADAVMAQAGKFGVIKIRRIYANWHNSARQGWLEPIANYRLRPIHQERTANGKNATDIGLVVDAMDLLYTREISCFCIVASDSDYTPLVLRLRDAERIVVVIGRPHTPPALVDACSVFVPFENLVSSNAQTPPAEKETALMGGNLDQAAPALTKVNGSHAVMSGHQESLASAMPADLNRAMIVLSNEGKHPTSDHHPAPAQSKYATVHHLVKQAWQNAAKKEGWVIITTLGSEVRKLDPAFNPKSHGYAGLAKILLAHPAIYELRLQPNGHYIVRLRGQK